MQAGILNRAAIWGLTYARSYRLNLEGMEMTAPEYAVATGGHDGASKPEDSMNG